MAFLSTDDVRVFLGSEPFFGQGQAITEIAPADVPALEAARHRGPPIVFLGLNPELEDASVLTSSISKGDLLALVDFKGSAFFSIDVSAFDPNLIGDALKDSKVMAGEKLDFIEAIYALEYLDTFSAGLFATARTMVHWNRYNKASFCIALLTNAHR